MKTRRLVAPTFSCLLLALSVSACGLPSSEAGSVGLKPKSCAYVAQLESKVLKQDRILRRYDKGFFSMHKSYKLCKFIIAKGQKSEVSKGLGFFIAP